MVLEKHMQKQELSPSQVLLYIQYNTTSLSISMYSLFLILVYIRQFCIAPKKPFEVFVVIICLFTGKWWSLLASRYDQCMWSLGVVTGWWIKLIG